MPVVAAYAGLAVDLAVPVDEVVVGVAAIALLLVGWAFVLRDLLRRDDLSTSGKWLWGLVAVVLAWVGIVLYLLFRPRGATAAERERQQQASDDFVRRHTQG